MKKSTFLRMASLLAASLLLLSGCTATGEDTSETSQNVSADEVIPEEEQSPREQEAQALHDQICNSEEENISTAQIRETIELAEYLNAHAGDGGEGDTASCLQIMDTLKNLDAVYEEYQAAVSSDGEEAFLEAHRQDRAACNILTLFECHSLSTTITRVLTDLSIDNFDGESPYFTLVSRDNGTTQISFHYPDDTLLINMTGEPITALNEDFNRLSAEYRTGITIMSGQSDENDDTFAYVGTSEEDGTSVYSASADEERIALMKDALDWLDRLGDYTVTLTKTDKENYEMTLSAPQA